MRSSFLRHAFAALCASFALAAGLPALAADANQASVAELESVKGIGPGLSAKITAARAQGPFKSWADLIERVSGLGPGNAAKLSANGLTVAGAGYDGSAAAAKPAATDKPAKAATPPAVKPAKG